MRNGKVALVTGSSKGIGRGIAYALAGVGYDIAVHYHSSEKEALEVVSDIEAMGVKTCLLEGDMGDPDVPGRLVKETVERLGRLDVLVSNAGFTVFQGILDITVEKMDALYRVNFRGMILMGQAAARYMVQEGIKGCILFNTSVRSFSPHGSDGVYGSLKAGLNRMIESFAIDLGKYGIRVNGFSPGVTNVRVPEPEEEAVHPFYKDSHRFIPLRRNGYAKDMGGPVVWLASDAASYVTGQVIRVDGGLSVVGAPESFKELQDFFDVKDKMKDIP
ncbi:MAG: 3-ketoacyl-ACP reductase [Paenibacillus sp.]|jgi:NAD(P)-dependent dehydrogenase (short-subunit alcohol dehydrogenase family)|nr:3-ketoacyl-ACP reductase [Paenibacillus sp.]